MRRKARVLFTAFHFRKPYNEGTKHLDITVFSTEDRNKLKGSNTVMSPHGGSIHHVPSETSGSAAAEECDHDIHCPVGTNSNSNCCNLCFRFLSLNVIQEREKLSSYLVPNVISTNINYDFTHKTMPGCFNIKWFV